MINTEPGAIGQDNEGHDEAAVDAVVRAGPRGAVVLAGLATAVVTGLWFAFYLLVFLPRSGTP